MLYIVNVFFLEPTDILLLLRIKDKERRWKDGVEKIERKVLEYQEVINRGATPTEKECAAENVAGAMEEVAELHTDPNVREYIKREAKTEEERDSLLMDIGKGINLLLMTPFVLVGAVLMAAGMLFEGVAKIVKGIWRLFIKRISAAKEH
ncbi:hypothetical protein M422DRAFT_186400 [Sphaerobolus stellatus SS14]|uniref:Uncharacterized protein n=1 Tax=Sphaerobolus stellatus (strain SS14) TaxID=990650 RepID=A0A0C9U9C7_SPHS4|nr:hypothetical protein M422DRAFT_186400 [Sphaerobolus stellatus SS14]